MEEQKVRYLDHYIQHHKVSLDTLLTFVKNSEKSVRECYGEYIALNSDDFVMMVLLDGLFILEYFRRSYDQKLKDENDRFLYRSKLRNSIIHDLILLQNQLPFFVLESLYDLVWPPNESIRPTFLNMSCSFFSNLNKQKLQLQPQAKVLHFTDLIRTFHLHPSSAMEPHNHPGDCEREHVSSYSAKELEQSGIIFKAISTKCLLDIKFKANDGVFRIPRLEIYDSTESLFRNIMVLEQYLYMDKRYICDYVQLMDNLINTCRDVELLVGKGIISNNLGDHEEVTNLFNSLNCEIMRTTKPSYFCNLYQALQNYYKTPWNSWKASLKRDYFSTPWQIASIIAATILLVLLLLQTIKAF